MKNITRFKLPVFVAAGLHGALFLSVPAGPVVSAHDSAVTQTHCPPLPPSKIIEMTDPDRSADDGPQSSGSAVSQLPDNPVARPAPDAFTMPVVSMQPTQGREVTLRYPPGGPTGTGDPFGPGGVPRIMGIGELDRVPQATVQPSPDYPAGLRREGVTGSVTVAFVVNAEGRVIRAEALKSTHREFVEPAVRAVLKWRFEPGKHHGRPTSFRMAVPIEFSVGTD